MQSYEIAVQAARPFDRFLDGVEANRDLWHAAARRAPLHEEAARRIAESPGCWRLLVLADDWCGDAVNTVPVIERLTREAPNVEMRIVPRDHFPEVRDRHLTHGKDRSPWRSSWTRMVARMVETAAQSLPEEEKVPCRRKSAA